MITRVSKGNCFRGVLAYAFMENKQPRLICSTLKTQNQREWATEFELQASRNARVKQAVYHYIKSLAPGEHLSDGQWTACVLEDAQALGFDQYIAAIHRDRRHEHLDIIVNSVKADGKTWAQWKDRVELRKTAQAQEIRYGLIRTRAVSDLPTVGKEEVEKAARLFDEGKAKTPIPTKLLIREAALAACAQANHLDGVTALLAGQGISARTRIDQNGRVVGISFGHDGQAFSGSSLGLPIRSIQARLSHDHRDINSPSTAPALAEGAGDRNCHSGRRATLSISSANSDAAGEADDLTTDFGYDGTSRTEEDSRRDSGRNSPDGVARLGTSILLLILGALVRMCADAPVARRQIRYRRPTKRPGIRFSP